MSTYHGPDHTALRLARYLATLDATHMVSLPDEIRTDVNRTISWHNSAVAEMNRHQDLAARKAAEKQAVLDSDLTVAKGAHKCEATVRSRGSWSYTPTCPKDSVVVRTWTTKEFAGLFLDGVKVDASDPRRSDEAFDASLERRYTETVHQMFLCGTHRQVKGSYGFPY